MPSPPIHYCDNVEVIQPGEDDDIERCIASLLRTNATTFDRHRHGYRATHAKSHGILRGELVVHDRLAPELGQGLFATPGRHPVVLRIATEVGQLDDDRTRNARGLALKVFNVTGETMHPDHDGHAVHDMLFNTLPTLGPGTARVFRELTEIRERNFNDPDGILDEVRQRPDADALTAFDRVPVLHPLGYHYYSQGAFRHGDYVAKYAMIPGSEAQAALAEGELSNDASPGALAKLLADWAGERETRFDLRVQLRTDAERMPVEDAAVEWPEALSAYETVASVRLAPQQPYSHPRRVFADDRLAFRPWHGLAAHRPLGSINRLRQTSYEQLGAQRFAFNDVRGTEMRSAEELPD